MSQETIKELMARSHAMTREEREATCCPECRWYYGTHRPSCSLATVESLRFELEGARQELSHSHRKWKRLCDQIALYQGKYNILRHENNKLRRRLERAMMKNAATLSDEEIDNLIAGLQDVKAGRVREVKRLKGKWGERYTRPAFSIDPDES